MSADYDIDGLSLADFKALPLVIEGESKEVRYLGSGAVAIAFKPTIYSFTRNRCALVPGSEIPRLRASEMLLRVLNEAGIRHAYRRVGRSFVLADLVMPHAVEFAKYGLPPFLPADLTSAQVEALPRAPPIEIVAKRYLTGTTKHQCVGMAGSRVRRSHPFYAGMELEGDGALPEIMLRFDWRNPLSQRGRGERMARQVMEAAGLEPGADHGMPPGFMRALEEYGDRCQDAALPPQLADLFIDTERAARTAFLAARAFEGFLAAKGIVFYDLCMFIDESGELMYGELSPDCGRFRHLDYGSLDKDVWRSGGSSGEVLEKWLLLCRLLGAETTEGKRS